MGLGARTRQAVEHRPARHDERTAKTCPDRAQGKLGTDNDYEYRLSGYLSGETVYEPASNGFYPEFILLGADVKSTKPPNIYQTERQRDPKVRILQPPP